MRRTARPVDDDPRRSGQARRAGRGLLTSRSVSSEHLPAPWADVDFDAEPDWDWRSAADDSPEELQALWEAAVGRSRAAVAAFLAGAVSTSRAKWTEWTEPPNLRRMLVDMIEEYARHTGHADLIRESIDGLVGEASLELDQ